MPDAPNTTDTRFRFQHIPEAILVRCLMALFAILPMDAASALGGFIARQIGPLAGASRKAAKRLQTFFPDLTTREIDKLIVDMWDNLGRTVAEFPHLAELDTTTPGKRIKITGEENFPDPAILTKPCIFFSAHFANWELVPLVVDQRGLPTTIAYREANNPFVNRMIRDLRSKAVTAKHVPKGPAGARALLQSLKDGSHLGLLVDQKMNDGIAVPFFGRDAMTAPALAQLALRYDAQIVPVHCERLEGARFRLVIEKPLEVVETGDKTKDIHNIMTAVNLCMENWIRGKPGQWMWVHNRWPDI